MKNCVPQVEKDVQDVWEAEHDDAIHATATELSGDSDSDATTTATAEGPRPDEVPPAWDNLRLQLLFPLYSVKPALVYII